MDLSATLAAYAAAASFSQLPPAVVVRAKQVVLDTLGAMIAGTMLEPGQAMRALAARLPTGESTIVGSSRPASPLDAAMVNGTLAHADEVDDSHFSSLTHPASTCLPGALALAEKVGVDGPTVLTALVLGYDVQCRVSLSLDPVNLQRRSFVPRALCGSLGAAAAAARVLGLDEGQTLDAFGLAGCNASGLSVCVTEPLHYAKALVAGMAARNGTLAAELAEADFHGPPAIFEGRDGLFKAFTTEPRAGELTSELGVRYEILGTSVKKYSCAGPIRGAVDALLRIMSSSGIVAGEIEAITARLPGPAADMVDDQLIPSINLQYVLAVAALDGRVDMEQTHDERRLHDASLLALKRKVVLVRDSELARDWPKVRPSVVTVTTRDGRELTERVEWPEGSPQNPMGQASVEAKFRQLATPVVGGETVERLIVLAGRLDTMECVTPITRLLRAEAVGG